MTTFIPADDFDLTLWTSNAGHVPGDMRKIDVDVEDGNVGGSTVSTIGFQIVESRDRDFVPESVALTIENAESLHSIMLGVDYYVYDGGTGTLVLTDKESGEPILSQVGTRSLITNEQAIEWAGRDVDLGALAEAIPHSSIPDAISTIVANLASHEEQCA